MINKKLLLIISFLLLILLVSFIVIYFIYFEEAENILGISKVFPYDTAFFWGIDDIAQRAKKIANSQTKIELDKYGMDNYINEINLIIDKELYNITSLHLRDWKNFMEDEVGFSFDYEDNNIVFAGVVKVSKSNRGYKDLIESKIFERGEKIESIKKYLNIEYRISKEGYIICLYKDILIVSNNEKYLKKICEVLLKKEKSLAQNKLFENMQLKLGYVGGYFSYINVEKVIKESKLMVFLIKKVLPLFGYDLLKYIKVEMIKDLISEGEIKAIGLSGEIVGEEIIQKTFLLTDKNREGLLNEFLNAKPEKLDIDNVVLNKSKDFLILYLKDASILYDKFEKNIQEINNSKVQLMYILMNKYLESIGIDIKHDLINLIGDQAILYDYIKGGDKRELGNVLIIKLKDGEKFKVSINKLQANLINYLPGVKEEEYKGNKIVCIEASKRISICYIVKSGYFYVATEDEILKESIELLDSKKGSITKDLRYKNCRNKIPRKNNFILYSKGTLVGNVIMLNESELNSNDKREMIRDAIKILQDDIEKGCGEISSGASREGGFVIQTYFPLSYVYVLEILFMQNLTMGIK